MTTEQNKIINVSCSVANAREQLLGVKTVRGTIINLESFSYNLNFQSAFINTGDFANTTTVLDADSDFLCLFLMATAYNNIGSLFTSSQCAALLQITDTTSNRSFFSSPAMVGNVCGSVGLPFILPESRLIFARTALNASFQNLIAAYPVKAQIGLVGLKVYYKGLPGTNAA